MHDNYYHSPWTQKPKCFNEIHWTCILFDFRLDLEEEIKFPVHHSSASEAYCATLVH